MVVQALPLHRSGLSMKPSKAAMLKDPDGASLLGTLIYDPYSERVTGEQAARL